MDAIKTYLENVFSAFPQSERVLTLKKEMLIGLEEKYHALKAEGKSEHEAVGSVIANFGSMEEIAAELGLNSARLNNDNFAKENFGVEQTAGNKISGRKKKAMPTMEINSGQVAEFLEATKKGAFWIGIGVCLILLGVAALIAIASLMEFSGVGNAIGITVLLCAIAGAVPMFIVQGIKLEKFEVYDEYKIILDDTAKAEIEDKDAKYTTRYITAIAVGVSLILVGVGVLVILGVLDFGAISIVPLLAIIGFSVFLFINAGMKKEAYDTLLGQGDYKNKEANKKMEKIIGPIAASYWPLIVVAYLLWSFIGNAWHISWIIWPIAGILFGAISGGLGAFIYTRDKD